MTKLEPRKVDTVTVDDLRNIGIGQTAAFTLPNFRKVRSAQSVASYYGKIKELGKKFKTQSRVEDNLLIIKAVEL
ncbi:hypothetical protein [uncultured Dysgonomonas sp.]|uniref:Uncharacterized protein n=1 Tax=uncultured Dysgonomonas sp. TaxID=206096 RepID=A0A212IX20_9BACT|nr:hypothetical protein [uncultured Dysgonomonas sp.]SBV91712.1 hypothetical protein KL86DYS1_10411 [uncultured Dysgonomonas sp.]